MYQNHTQVGRTRVNKIREGKKNPPGSKELYKRDGLTHVRPRSSISNDIPQYKVVGQIKKKNVTGMDKLYSLQKDLLMDGLSLEEYKDYVQDKINNGKYYYKNLSVKDVASLNKRYRRLLQEEKILIIQLVKRRNLIVDREIYIVRSARWLWMKRKEN